MSTPTDSFQVYDTTLRDGAQQEGLTLSVADKLAIARQIDELGVGYIEGGWPGAGPKDTEFFRRAVDELTLRNATLAAFGTGHEAFRPAPRYDFAAPPHAGPAYYDGFDWGMTGTAWRDAARRARLCGP